MYEMEEGIGQSSDSLVSSSDGDEKRFEGLKTQKKVCAHTFSTNNVWHEEYGEFFMV